MPSDIFTMVCGNAFVSAGKKILFAEAISNVNLKQKAADASVLKILGMEIEFMAYRVPLNILSGMPPRAVVITKKIKDLKITEIVALKCTNHGFIILCPFWNMLENGHPNFILSKESIIIKIILPVIFDGHLVMIRPIIKETIDLFIIMEK